MVDTATHVEVPPDDSAPEDADVARQIAKALRERSGQRGAWFEVRSLMNRFDIDRLSPDACKRMDRALAGAGLRPEPSLHDVTRRDTLVLSWLHEQSRPTDGRQTSSTPLSELLTLRIARPGESLEEADPNRPVADGVRWFDLRETNHVDADEFLALVNPHCNMQLTRDMVVDLLTPDPKPKVTEYDGGSVRGASAFRVSVEESDEGTDAESVSIAGVLVLEPVEMIVAEDWVISAWHDAEMFRGAERIGERPQRHPADLDHEVDRCWRSAQLRTGGDIATALLYELSLSFKPAVRALQMQEEEWELDFFRRPDRLDRQTLLETHAEATVLRDWLLPLNRPGMSRDAERAWFPAITGSADAGGWERALGADVRIGAALKILGEFGSTLRSAYDLLQLRQNERERARDERFQRSIALGGAAILIPTLLAGVMGANTWVPGEYGPHSSHWPFYVLLVLIVIFAAGAWFLLARAQRRPDGVYRRTRGRGSDRRDTST